jgi:hypothetical protein
MDRLEEPRSRFEPAPPMEPEPEEDKNEKK